jgi:hypothetical protein|tara:strand:+ start:818 stop:1066 length:249 start_codon:yes stop_codon:yes gene_type:complete
VSKSYLKECDRVEVGDLVTYRSIKELTEENFEQKILIHGVGIVVSIDDEFAKVYWIHAKQFLWIFADKLTTFTNLSKIAPRY